MNSTWKKIISSAMSIMMVSSMLQIPAYAEEETVLSEETEEQLIDEEPAEAEEETVHEEVPETEEFLSETTEEAEVYSISDLTEKLQMTITPDKRSVTMRLSEPEDVYELIKNERLYILYTENIGFGNLKDLDSYTGTERH